MCGWLGFSQDKLNDVVLTPSYISTLLVKLVRVNKDSYVWDFTSGSAGLLVAAMNEMLIDAKKSIKSSNELTQKQLKIKAEQLLGLEILPDVYMLAILNMILMGDGRSNILNKDYLLDFEFMENFVAEMETGKIKNLDEYLEKNNLKDYTLTTEEKQVLEDLENDKFEWGEYKIGDLFENLSLKFLKKTFDKEGDVSREKTLEFSLPLVNAKNGNNGIMYYGRVQDFENAEMCIDIVNDGAISTGNVYSQPQKTGVLYNAYLVKPRFNDSKKLLHFFASAMQKSINHKKSIIM